MTAIPSGILIHEPAAPGGVLLPIEKEGGRVQGLGQDRQEEPSAQISRSFLHALLPRRRLRRDYTDGGKENPREKRPAGVGQAAANADA